MNRRVYDEDRKIVWRKHWVKHEIVDETSRSWITAWGKKISKKAPGPHICFNEEEIDKMAWVHDNSYKISLDIRRLADHEILKAVAILIGYKENEK